MNENLLIVGKPYSQGFLTSTVKNSEFSLTTLNINSSLLFYNQ